MLLRPVLAAAGLDGAALRPQGADDGILPGHRRGADRRAAWRPTPLLLAVALAGAGLFAAIYHPIGTTMLVEAAGDKPGRAIGVNGVFGNLGVALAPVVTAFLANQVGWRAAFIVPGHAVRSRSACCGCASRWPTPPRAARLPPVPADPAPPGAARGDRADADRHRLRPGVQRLHPAAAETDAGAAGRQRRAAAAGRRRARSWPRCAAR